MKISRGCSVSMWLWIAVTSMPFVAQRLDHRIDLVAGQHEVAGDGGLAAAGRLEVDRGRDAHRAGRRDLHPVLGDRVAARHAELIDAAIGLPFDADDLVELGGVEIDRGRGGRSAPAASAASCFRASAVRIAVAIFTGSPCPPTCM